MAISRIGQAPKPAVAPAACKSAGLRHGFGGGRPPVCSPGDHMALRLWTSAPAVYSGKAGFGKRPALLLIDFVEGYFDKTYDLYSGVDDALASALRVAKRRGRRACRWC